MARPLLLVISAALAAALVAGCGGSTAPTEEDAATLLQNGTGATAVVCVRREGADRQFDCKGKNSEGVRIVVSITVSENEEVFLVERCRAAEEEAAAETPCKGIS